MIIDLMMVMMIEGMIVSSNLPRCEPIACMESAESVCSAIAPCGERWWEISFPGDCNDITAVPNHELDRCDITCADFRRTRVSVRCKDDDWRGFYNV